MLAQISLSFSVYNIVCFLFYQVSIVALPSHLDGRVDISIQCLFQVIRHLCNDYLLNDLGCRLFARYVNRVMQHQVLYKLSLILGPMDWEYMVDGGGSAIFAEQLFEM